MLYVKLNYLLAFPVKLIFLLSTCHKTGAILCCCHLVVRSVGTCTVPVSSCRQQTSQSGVNFSYRSTCFPNSLPELLNFNLVNCVFPKHWFSSTRLHGIRNKREVSFPLPLLFERDEFSYTLWYKRQKTRACLFIIIIIIIIIYLVDLNNSMQGQQWKMYFSRYCCPALPKECCR